MADINKLTVVQISQGVSGRPTVVKWNPGSYEQPTLSGTWKVLGVSATDAVQGADVACIKQGYLRDCPFQNSETWLVGDILYAKSDGSVSKTRQAGPMTQLIVGTVFAVSGSYADVDVNLQIIPSLGELSGVSQETPADKDVFIYKSSTHVWEPRQIDHGADLAGLADDDHPQYLTPARHADEMHRPARPAPHTHRIEDVIGAGSGSGDPMMPMKARPHTHGGEDIMITISNTGAESALTMGDFILASQIFGG